MRKSYALLPVLLLAACNQQDQNRQTADTAAPAAPVTAEPVAPAPAAPAEQAPLNPLQPGEPGGLPDDRTPISEGPIQPGSAQEAANVVQTYYALLGEGKYTQAWALWDNGGKASGMTAQQFADSFRRYSEYYANVGGPGRVDAGAGQRHVTVPVQVYGRLRDGGRPFNLRGDVVLHRVADVPGSTAEQRSWRISTSEVNPKPSDPIAPMPQRPDNGPSRGDRPDRGGPDRGGPDRSGPDRSGPDRNRPGGDAPPRATQPAMTTANYRCEGGITLTVDLDNKAGTATVRGGGRKSRSVLKIQPVASGIHYAGNGYTLRGKGDDASWTAPGAKSVECHSGR